MNKFQQTKIRTQRQDRQNSFENGEQLSQYQKGPHQASPITWYSQEAMHKQAEGSNAKGFNHSCPCLRG